MSNETAPQDDNKVDQPQSEAFAEAWAVTFGVDLGTRSCTSTVAEAAQKVNLIHDQAYSKEVSALAVCVARLFTIDPRFQLGHAQPRLVCRQQASRG